jgi:MYXO-CTERM domain-containing protein
VQVRAWALVVAIAVGSASAVARADTGPPSGLASIIQEGQDVVVGLQQDESVCHLWRRDLTTDEETAICDGREFVAEERAGRTATACHDSYIWDCETQPDHCVDCDGDGVNECSGYCWALDLYSVVDPCVAPGQYEYRTYAALSGIGVRSIDVTDTGDACLHGGIADADVDIQPDAGGDADADADSDVDADGDGDGDSADDGGCSSAPSRTPSPSTLLAALMLGAGLWLARRR